MTDFAKAFRQRVKNIILDESVRCDDGYLVWWPTQLSGSFSADHLRLMADILDEENKEWDEQVKRDVG